MQCLWCKKESADKVCPACLELAKMALKEAKTFSISDSVGPIKPRKIFYHLTVCATFDCVVDEQELEAFGSVERASMSRMHPWYLVEKKLDVDNIDKQEFTHDDFTKWVRSE